VLLSGEPGIGKSRLLKELLDRLGGVGRIDPLREDHVPAPAGWLQRNYNRAPIQTALLVFAGDLRILGLDVLHGAARRPSAPWPGPRLRGLQCATLRSWDSSREGAAMRSFALYVVAFTLLSASAATADMPVAPCSTLHFRVIGDDFSSKCRGSESKNAQGSWRTENIWATSAKGVLFLVRETPTDSGTRMKPVAPREVAEEFRPKGIEDWGPRCA
jgi:hypothetical protein